MARIVINFTDQTLDKITEKAWNLYKENVGNVAHDGSPLPDWSAFKGTKQGKAWLAMIEGVIETKVNL